jgi:hypothetical protein
MRVRCNILSSAACLAIPFFPHYPINSKIFGKVLLNTKYVLIFSPTFVCIFSHCTYVEFSQISSQTNAGVYVKYSLFLSDFNQSSIFSTNFRKVLKFEIFVKILPVGAEYSMRTDRHGDVSYRFSQFCERDFWTLPRMYVRTTQSGYSLWCLQETSLPVILYESTTHYFDFIYLFIYFIEYLGQDPA